MVHAIRKQAFSQQEIADALSISRARVGRLLREYDEAGQKRDAPE